MPLKLVFTSASQRKHSGWTKFLVRQMDAVIATSAKTAAYLDVPNTVVMHGIDCEKFRPAEDKTAAKRACGLNPDVRYIGCFGRVRHQKGTDLFVDAMIDLLPAHPGFAAIIAGRATPQHVAFEDDLKARVRAAGLTDRILFVGEHTNIADWYRALDLFIAPQRWEGFGLTPLEAMATGVPVVATDVGAFAELVQTGEHPTGTVIERDNLNAMKAAVGPWLDDTDKRTAASEDGRTRTTQHFRIEGEAAQIACVYSQTTILIVGKDSSYGLTKDGLLLEKGLRDAGFTGQIRYAEYKKRPILHRLLRLKAADLGIHIERIYPRWLTGARKTFVIPNQERFPRRHLGRLRKIDSVLAKSDHAAEIFRRHGSKTSVISFTSEDRNAAAIAPDYGRYLHVAGASTLKGTEDLLALWAKHPEWPELTLVMKRHLAPQSVPSNIRLLTEYLPDEALLELQNGCGIHLCPSRAEGWGHYIVEALSCSALVITTDAPPMNEVVDAECGILVRVNHSTPRHLGTSFFVDPKALEEAIEYSIVMPLAEKEAMGRRARARFDVINRQFPLKLRDWLAESQG